MQPDQKALQQWASNIARSEFWTSLIEETRVHYIDELVAATQARDQESVNLFATKLLVLDDVTNTLISMSVDVNFKRDYHEVLNDAE